MRSKCDTEYGTAKRFWLSYLCAMFALINGVPALGGGIALLISDTASFLPHRTTIGILLVAFGIICLVLLIPLNKWGTKP